ncbi:MAG: cytochrome ubiquinol oxidase subunit I [Candidatus Latescibacterota bacterium]
MDALLLARLQFAVTTVYHFFFVPLTLGLSLFVALLETAWVRTRDPVYLRMTRFWGKLFLINFAMGVATGIVQEFQFGMNWSEYSRFVGDVFGAPLAIEALLAFFLESTFLGVWIFGWERLSPAKHLAAIWMVALGSNLSALWILIANSFMQEPVGFALRHGRAEMTDFAALILNPHVWVQFPHVFFAGVTTAAFFVLGISAWHLRRPREEAEVYRRSFRLAGIYGVVGAVLVMVLGHNQAQHMVGTQPMKMAAAEALWESEDPAAMSLFTWGDEANRRDVFAVRVPSLLSILAYNRPGGEVKGIKQIQAEYEARYGPGNYVPPVAITYWTFRLMAGAGLLMLVLALYAAWLASRPELILPSRFLALLVWAIGLPYLANSTGWLMTEIGRMPWVVFGVMRVEAGLSPTVGVPELLFSLAVFTLLYGALMAADFYLLRQYARAGVAAAAVHG